MMAGMTTGVKAKDEVGLFIHQMIPHHQVGIPVPFLHTI
jgi:uncharacterized protein (DUF305 family)